MKLNVEIIKNTVAQGQLALKGQRLELDRKEANFLILIGKAKVVEPGNVEEEPLPTDGALAPKKKPQKKKED